DGLMPAPPARGRATCHPSTGRKSRPACWDCRVWTPRASRPCRLDPAQSFQRDQPSLRPRGRLERQPYRTHLEGTRGRPSWRSVHEAAPSEVGSHCGTLRSLLATSSAWHVSKERTSRDADAVRGTLRPEASSTPPSALASLPPCEPGRPGYDPERRKSCFG